MIRPRSLRHRPRAPGPNRPASLDCRGLEIHEGEYLTDQHLPSGQMPAAQLVAPRKQVKIAIARMHQLASVAAIEDFEMSLCIEKERIPIGLVAIDVTALAQGYIELREQRIADYVLESSERRFLHLLLPPGSSQSSIWISPGTCTQGRCRADRGFASVATRAAILPIATNRRCAGR